MRRGGALRHPDCSALPKPPPQKEEKRTESEPSNKLPDAARSPRHCQPITLSVLSSSVYLRASFPAQFCDILLPLTTISPAAFAVILPAASIVTSFPLMATSPSFFVVIEALPVFRNLFVRSKRRCVCEIGPRDPDRHLFWQFGRY